MGKSAVCGFTKIELLIAVATFSILGAIAVPSFVEPPMPKVSRLKNDMRSMATALESYFIDHRSYPGSRPLEEFAAAAKVSRKALREIHAMGLGTVDPGGIGRAGITTPISYVSSLFEDPASPKGKLPYVYGAKNGGWILVSPGPDLRYDIDPALDYEGDTTTALLRLMPKTYDSTNGVRSSGDVWRVKQ